MATISRMLKNIGLFCKRALQKRPVFCKETCIFKHPTHRSHPILPLASKVGIQHKGREKKRGGKPVNPAENPVVIHGFKFGVFAHFPAVLVKSFDDLAEILNVQLPAECA